MVRTVYCYINKMRSNLLLNIFHRIFPRDIANDSDLQTFPVKKSDLIILGSDGIYDVLSDTRIEDIVNKRKPKDVQGIADDLLQKTMTCKCFLVPSRPQFIYC